MQREMKDSRVEWIGDIPSTWTTSKLKYIGTYINGYAFKSSMFTKSGTRVLRLQDLSKSYINPQYFEGTLDQRFVATKGDILVSWNATLDTFLWDGEDAYFKHHILKAIHNEDKVSKAFFYWLLKLAMKNMSGDGIVMTHLRLGDFSDFTVPMPPLAEQTRIAEYLNEKCSDIDALIAQTKSSIEEYEALLLSYISNAVVKGIRADRTLVDSGYSLVGEIPSEWSVSKLKNLYEVLNGIPIEGERMGSGYPFLSYGDIDNLVLSETTNGLAETTEAERERYTVQRGDIFFTRTTESLESVGVSSVCLNDIENAIYTSLLVRVRPLTDIVLPSYAKYYFRSSHIRQYIHSKVNRGASVNLTQEVLKAMPILIPTKEEQIEIATYLDEKYSQIVALIEKKQALIKEMENYKYSVIFEALTGKKEVQMKDSGIEWIGEIPRHWKVGRTKNCYTNHKDVVGDEADNYERLALTLGGVIKRSKVDATGLQPEAFEGYQILRENELVFKLIDLENVATSRVGYSPYTGIVSPAYIVLTPRETDESRFGEYFFLSMWQREVFNHMGDDGVRSSLNSKDLLNIPYLIVPSGEKAKIVAFLDKQCAEIDSVIEQTKATIEEYKKLKQSVITEAVTKGIRGDRPMKDSGYEYIGRVPSEWTICRLRNIGSPQNGISKGGEFFGSGYPFVSYGDVYKNFALPTLPTGLIETTEEERERYSVKKGDIFFTRTSETIEEIGISSVCEQDIANATFAGFLIRVRPFSNKICWRFSKYYFRSNHHRTYFVKEINLVTRASLGQDLLKSMPVLLPPMEEQTEISDYLDQKCAEIDTLIEKKTALLEEMEALKKSTIFEYVTGKKEVAP